MRRTTSLPCLCCFTWLFVLGAGAALAADVETGVSTRETYVGLPIVLRIRVNNALEHEEPIIPDVDGLTIESAGPPAQSSQISIINGRRTHRSTVTYSYRVTPQREGNFTIPPVKVVADNYITMTKAVRIVASKSDTNDLLLVEVEGKQSEIYVGQALDLTLKIYVRPYRDKEHQITLDEEDMWSLVSEQTNWGSFADSLREMAQDRKRPGGRPVLREDSEGNEREYLLYEIDATVYPDRPGEIDGDAVRIIMNYPEALGRLRSPFSLLDDDDFFGGVSPFDDSFFQNFGARLGVTKSRPIVAETTVDPIRVKPIPQQGRPDNYLGAVGQYTIIAEASPTRVKVGDPITLRIGIDGDGPMDLVRAPPLASQRNLANDFKVPDEPLAGFVDGSRKIFSTTLRPLRDDVDEIPPIELSYFDPIRDQFVTAKSQPIRIEVEKAEMLALDAIVGAGGRSDRPSDSTSAEGKSQRDVGVPVLSGPELLKNQPRPQLISRQLMILIAMPPLGVLLLSLFAVRHVFMGLVSSRRQLRRALSAAENPDQVAEALAHFFARRFRLDDGKRQRDQTVGRLRAAGHHDVAIRTERLYAASSRTPLASSASSLDSLKQEAWGIASDSRRPRTQKWMPPLRRTASASVLLLCFVIGAESHAEWVGERVILSPRQQAVMLDEAVSQLDEAVEARRRGADGASMQAQFALAAEKLQLLVDSGIENDRLHFNLATAYRGAGETGKAIAHYRRALRLNSSSTLYRGHLASAESEVANTKTSVPTIKAANDAILGVVSPRWMLSVSLVAWFVFWGAIAARIMNARFAWKSVTAATLCIAVATAASYFLGVGEYLRDDQAVLVRAEVSIREGDGEQFAEIASLSRAEGQVVTVLDQRDQWLRIRTGDGDTGWVHVDTSERI